MIYEYKDENGQIKRKGLLIDWELSKPLSVIEKRQPERTVSSFLKIKFDTLVLTTL